MCNCRCYQLEWAGGIGACAGSGGGARHGPASKHVAGMAQPVVATARYQPAHLVNLIDCYPAKSYSPTGTRDAPLGALPFNTNRAVPVTFTHQPVKGKTGDENDTYPP